MEPPPIQYAIWLGRVVRLDLGTTFKTRRPVIDELAERLPTTAKLAFLSFGILLVTAIPLGVVSAVNQGKAADHGVRFVALVFSAMPSFWLGLLLLYLLGVQWKVIDISGGSELKHLILPAVVMALGIVPTIARLLRASLISELGQLYIVFARAQGLSDGVVLWRHAVRVAVLPIMALLGLYLGGALGGSVIVESIFSIPGSRQVGPGLNPRPRFPGRASLHAACGGHHCHGQPCCGFELCGSRSANPVWRAAGCLGSWQVPC